MKPHLQDQRLGKTGQNVPKIRIVSVANSGTVASTNSVSSDAINFAALRHGDSVITLFFLKSLTEMRNKLECASPAKFFSS